MAVYLNGPVFPAGLENSSIPVEVVPVKLVDEVQNSRTMPL